MRNIIKNDIKQLGKNIDRYESFITFIANVFKNVFANTAQKLFYIQNKIKECKFR